MIYRITDKEAVYPIYQITLSAPDRATACRLAFEAMTGAHLNEVDEKVAREIIQGFWVESYQTMPSKLLDLNAQDVVQTPTFESVLATQDGQITMKIACSKCHAKATILVPDSIPYCPLCGKPITPDEIQ